MKKLNVVFFGTPDFSVPALDTLSNHPAVELKFVVSMPDRKAGRGYELKSPEVIEYAKNNKIPFFQTENINKESEFLNKLKGIDVFIVLAFAQFLKDEVLNIPKLGSFNIHTSLLPKYRGAAPIQYAILNGDKSTGVSIQKMVKKMDAGDIVKSKEVAIHDDETGGQLYTKLKHEASLCLNNFIWELQAGKLDPKAQDESNVSFAPTLKREDGKLNFKEDLAENIRNRVRALYPWPGTYCFLNGKRLKVFEVNIVNENVKPGTTNTKFGELIVGCKDQALRLTSVQLEGKKRSSDQELLNGIKDEIKIK